MLPSATSRNRRDKLPSASSTAVDVLIGVLAQLKEVSDIVPVPYFKVAIVGLYQTVMTVKVSVLHCPRARAAFLRAISSEESRIMKILRNS
jgi:hypothetical protein